MDCDPSGGPCSETSPQLMFSDPKLGKVLGYLDLLFHDMIEQDSKPARDWEQVCELQHHLKIQVSKSLWNQNHICLIFNCVF